DLLCWQSDYAGGSLNVNGTIMRDTYRLAIWFGSANRRLRGGKPKDLLILKSELVLMAAQDEVESGNAGI
ncbi:hypothetical protein VC306_09805, partial [Citrobacter portucalensis]|nr:hypothetical protein [Citrobacter portucalensis]